MKELDYHPNMLARSLVNKSTKIVGLLVPSSGTAFGLPFYSEILRGIVSKANQNDYRILLSNISSDEEEEKTINELAHSCIVEGFILMTSRLHDESLMTLTKMNFPFVMVGKPEQNFENQINWVDNDNFEAGYRLTKHIIDKGHKKIAFIGVSDKYMVTVDRFNGYKLALHDSGIEFDKDLVINGEFMKNNASIMLKALFDRNKEFNGLITADDYQAFSAVSFLNTRGLSVPNDIAVAGFNNVPQSEYFVPPLTSVDVHPYKLGEKSFELLYQTISNSGVVCHEYVKTDLIQRKST
jgi:DNA-binding LacI/PurR family transcriptional regulator